MLPPPVITNVLNAMLEALRSHTELDCELTSLPYLPGAGHGNGPDAILSVKAPGSREPIRYAVAARQQVRDPGELYFIKHELDQYRGHLPLLAAARLSRTVLEACRRMGLSACDTRGNIYLTGPGLHIHTSNRPHHLQQQESAPIIRTDNFASPASLKILFCLLADSREHNGRLRITLRELAGQAGVSLGSVHRIIANLEDHGYCQKTASAALRLLKPDLLTDLWLSSYNHALRPKLYSARYAGKIPSEWWTQLDLKPHHALWGGETAAWLLLHELRPATQCLYVPPEHRAELTRKVVTTFQLRPDPAGSFEILDRFWTALQSGQQDQDHSGLVAKLKYPTVPELLICADLMQETDSRIKTIVNELLLRVRREY